MVDWFAVAVFVLGNMVAGVIGNRTDALFCQCWQTIYERLRQGSPRDNHDLQRAIRKAILQATLCLLSDALMERGVDVQNWLSRLWRRLPFGQPRDEESRWLWRVYNELSAELSRVSSAEDVPPSPVAENELALLLQPQGVTAEKRAKELQERVTDEWLNELRELSASGLANRQRFSLGGCGRDGNRLKRPSDFSGLTLFVPSSPTKSNTIKSSPTSSWRSCWRA
jgi:hypothetical protein